MQDVDCPGYVMDRASTRYTDIKGQIKLSKRIDKESCQCYSKYDKESCQNVKRSCHTERRTMPLINRLKEHRARLGVNQAELGNLAGVSRQTISLIERGDYSPSVTLALKLAQILSVTVEDIFSYEEEETK